MEIVWFSSCSVSSCNVTASLIYRPSVFFFFFFWWKQCNAGFHPPVKCNKSWRAIGDLPLSASLAISQTYTFNMPSIDWFYGTWLTLSATLPSWTAESRALVTEFTVHGEIPDMHQYGKIFFFTLKAWIVRLTVYLCAMCLSQVSGSYFLHLKTM